LFYTWREGCREYCFADVEEGVKSSREVGHNDAAKALPRHPHGRVLSCDIIDDGVLPTRTLARRDFNASSRCVFCLMRCSACISCDPAHGNAYSNA
jgi:hypothetical protein